jgi:glutamine---fructose-6-phosphate transaminase (isomerizing)
MKITQMEKEARQAPDVVARQIKDNAETLQEIGKVLRKSPPNFAMTIGRGSSDHACTFAKYLFETKLNTVTASAAPSVLTIYNADLKVKKSLVVAVSQSGKSPDICEVMRIAHKKGATTVAIVNEKDSPLTKTARFVLPMLAGKEQAVAATKSYIASLTSLAGITGYWSQDKLLLRGIEELPERLQNVLAMDWSSALPLFADIESTLVLARGYGFPIAQEAALKFKETTAIQAESFSSAEVLHGPFALIQKRHPYLLFTQNDASIDGIMAIAKKIKAIGGKSIVALFSDNYTKKYLKSVADLVLPLPKTAHPICDPVVIIQAFYVMMARLAVMRGYDPDKPRNLQKVTKTI